MTCLTRSNHAESYTFWGSPIWTQLVQNKSWYRGTIYITCREKTMVLESPSNIYLSNSFNRHTGMNCHDFAHDVPLSFSCHSHYFRMKKSRILASSASKRKLSTLAKQPEGAVLKSHGCHGVFMGISCEIHPSIVFNRPS